MKKAQKFLAIILSAVIVLSSAVTAGAVQADIQTKSILSSTDKQTPTPCGEVEDDSGSCGENATYTFDSGTGTLTISGTGNMTYWENSNSVPWSGCSSLFNKLIANLCFQT